MLYRINLSMNAIVEASSRIKFRGINSKACNDEWRFNVAPGNVRSNIAIEAYVIIFTILLLYIQHDIYAYTCHKQANLNFKNYR